MIREHADKLLSDVHQILTAHNLTHFLIDGTLLGAVREKDYIEHDTDIDLGVYAEQWTEDIVATVCETATAHGIVTWHIYGVFGSYFQITLKRDDIKLDLFFYRTMRSLRYFHAFQNGGKDLPNDVITYAYPAEMIDVLTVIDFRGMMLPVPAQFERVLEEKYGLDWRTVRKDWDWRFSPKNLVHKYDGKK